MGNLSKNNTYKQRDELQSGSDDDELDIKELSIQEPSQTSYQEPKPIANFDRINQGRNSPNFKSQGPE
jgi:hypothetical protein